MKKLIPIFTLVILCFYSCKKETKKTVTQSKEVPVWEQQTPQLQNNTTAGVIGGAHYICPNKCVGGTSDKQGICSVCNTVLAHNQGFHNTPNINTTPNSTTNNPTSGPNAAGQYHYTCANGCAGGGDSIGKCSSCSGDLAHNTAYHN